MKILKRILWTQLFICVFLGIVSFLNAFKAVQNAPKVFAYERILRQEKREFAEDKKYEVLGFTPRQFAEQASYLAKDNLLYSGRLLLVFLIASVVTLIEILILKQQMKKQDINR